MLLLGGAAAGAVGAAAMSALIGINYAPLLDFIAANIIALKNFVAIAFQSHPHLASLIDQIKQLWSRSGS